VRGTANATMGGVGDGVGVGKFRCSEGTQAMPALPTGTRTYLPWQQLRKVTRVRWWELDCWEYAAGERI